MRDTVIDRVRELWAECLAGEGEGPDYLAAAKLVRGVFHICDVKKNPQLMAQVEEMVDFLKVHIPLMDIDELIPCVKTIQHAERSIAAIRGTQYGAALSRSITAREAAELRLARPDCDRGSPESSLSGDQSDPISLSDLLSDLDDDHES